MTPSRTICHGHCHLPANLWFTFMCCLMPGFEWLDRGWGRLVFQTPPAISYDGGDNYWDWYQSIWPGSTVPFQRTDSWTAGYADTRACMRDSFSLKRMKQIGWHGLMKTQRRCQPKAFLRCEVTEECVTEMYSILDQWLSVCFREALRGPADIPVVCGCLYAWLSPSHEHLISWGYLVASQEHHNYTDVNQESLRHDQTGYFQGEVWCALGMAIVSV